MQQYVIATVKSWNINNANILISDNTENEFHLITEKNELTEEFLEKIRPRYIFFPHWSWIIPEKIYTSYDCVVFHMTDLPFGRGGSPLQNLLVRGIYDTKISAIKVCSGIDAGPVYCKEPVNISDGNADEILTKISNIVFTKMIPKFLAGELPISQQEGEVVSFRRRTPEQSEIPDGLSQRQIYDYIRMLDGEGYPRAFRKICNGKVCYSNARFIDDKVYADAVFIGGDH